LAELLKIDGGYLSRILKAFEKDHIISRHQSQADGRTFFLRLTAKGSKLLNTIDERSSHQIQKVLSPLQSGQQHAVTSAMKTIQHILSLERRLTLSDIAFRYHFQPGDVGYLIYMHGELYARETGYNQEFEAYVCKTFYEFLQRFDTSKDRIFLATFDEQIIGAVAILGHSRYLAQLRWLLVHPDFRDLGLGKKLVEDAIAFCKEKQYSKVYLLTTNQQTTAIKLYLAAGFRKTGEKNERMWGQDLYEERYDLDLESN
jgi:DNA-binding MarR family transcriptional regulator/N-acetylglutamate synthase-like GNAT family acetyltransferase